MAGIYTAVDIQTTDTGDFMISPNGDFKLATIDQTQKQDAIIRLFTEYNGFNAIPEIGSLIIDFIGEPNTSQNAQYLQAEIMRALTVDGRFSASDIQVEIVPIAIDQVLVYVNIANAASISITKLTFLFSYTTGLQIQYLS